MDPAVQESAPAAEVAPPPAPVATGTRPPPAATDLYPRDAEERRLCEKASTPDWLYMAIPPVLVAGAIVLDSQGLKFQENAFLRTLGPASVGLTWGFMVGGTYLALPKCSPTYVSTIPVEGDVRASWPMAFALAMFAGATAPVIVGIETGPLPLSWTTVERSMRLVTAGVVAFGSALLPYLLPPKTWRAMKQLQDIRAGATKDGFFVSVGLTF